MKIPLNRLLPALGIALAIGGGLAAQVRMPEDEDPIKRLFPKSANPDQTLNCAPPCGRLEPCC
jgi:hypothetical protein